MNAKEILNQLINAGRELTDKGVDYAEQQLDIPEEGPERDEKLKSVGKGAAIGAGLMILLGTRGGRALTGATLKLGTLAAAGGLAYKTFRDWQASQGEVADSPAGIPVGELEGAVAENRSTTLLRALIAAANADGTILENERSRSMAKLSDIGIDPEEQRFLEAELATPATVQQIADAADSPTAANEIYLLTAAFIDQNNDAERDYLETLAKALNLPETLAEQLAAT